MAMFEYEARNDDGEALTGVIRANTLDHAGRLLSEQDLFVVRIRSQEAARLRLRTSGHASRSQVVWILWQVSVMVETGMRLNDALSCLALQASQPRVRVLLEQLVSELNDGRSLSEAMETHPRTFPSSLVALIRASELSGTLGIVLRKSSAYLIDDQKTRRRLCSALMYPAFMLLICLMIGIFLVTVILPKFAAVFASRSVDLPLPTRVLMAMSDALLGNAHAVVLGTLTIVVGAVIALRTSQGRRYRDYLLVTTPGISRLFRALYQSRTFRTMALLTEHHVPLLDAIKVLQTIVPNAFYRELWEDVAEEIEVGEHLAGPLLRSDLIATSVAQVIDNGDRAGRLHLVFEQLAEFMEEEYSRTVTTAMQFIEPAMILLMGSIIAFIAVSLMLPLVRASQVVAG